MTWTLDKTHSEVTFSVRHMMVSTVRGRFEEFDANIEIDAEQPERSSVTATIEAASLTTGNADRDAHLRSADFFAAEEHPQITFASNRVERAGDDGFQLYGDLVIRGTSHPIELRGEFRGPVAHLAGGSAVGFTLSGEIDREAYGLTWNMALDHGGLLVGKTVKINIETEVLSPAIQIEEAAA